MFRRHTVLLEDGQVAVPNRGSAEVFFYDRVVGPWLDELVVEHVRVHRIIGLT